MLLNNENLVIKFCVSKCTLPILTVTPLIHGMKVSVVVKYDDISPIYIVFSFSVSHQLLPITYKNWFGRAAFFTGKPFSFLWKFGHNKSWHKVTKCTRLAPLLHQAPFLSDGGGLVIDEVKDGGSPYRKIAAFSEIIWDRSGSLVNAARPMGVLAFI